MHPTRESARRRPPARQLLLTAAARVFARDGLEGATTRAISREAGVNEVTLFRQFGTKERLIEAVVGSEFGKAGGQPAAPEPGSRSLRADLEHFARRYEDLLVANLPLIRTMLGEIHRHAVCQHQALKGIFWPMRAALVERIRLARRSGEARPGVNPSIAADLFAGTIFSAVIRRSKPRSRRDYSAADYRAASVDVFLGGIAGR
jgi:AcrR family transcriptional regulator